ncbi:MAG: hypothetical protein K8L91_03660 [Anaerolineae bacterium]|nr:hypothetical protein [Anaerolineae bacterium]
MERLLQEIDKLSPAELDTVYRYIVQRRQMAAKATQTNPAITLPAYQQTSQMSDREIESLISEELSEANPDPEG